MKLAGVWMAGNLSAVLVEGDFPVWPFLGQVAVALRLRDASRPAGADLPEAGFQIINGMVRRPPEV